MHWNCNLGKLGKQEHGITKYCIWKCGMYSMIHSTVKKKKNTNFLMIWSSFWNLYTINKWNRFSEQSDSSCQNVQNIIRTEKLLKLSVQKTAHKVVICLTDLIKGIRNKKLIQHNRSEWMTHWLFPHRC